MLKIKLSKDLRRSVKRGHPWVYKNSIAKVPESSQVQLCQLLDTGGQPLAWAMYDPHSPLALRIMSLEKKPPTQKTYESRLLRAWQLRQATLDLNTTNCFRLLNGEGDGLPGLVCDIYANTAVLQMDGSGARDFWDKKWIVEWLKTNISIQTVIEKTREDIDGSGKFHLISGDLKNVEVTVKEHGNMFLVNLQKGQKTGFFLDQRENRKYVGKISKGLNVLNLYSYTGGFSIYAGSGGASEVTSVDVSAGAIEQSEDNWKLNGLPPGKHHGIVSEVSDFLFKNKDQKWDVIIVDPPSMAHSEIQKELGMRKYVDIFAQAVQKLSPQGHLILSSCSSHISFDDFFEIINQTLSKANTRAQIVRVSGQGPDHPFPHACHEFRYLKFAHLRI